MTEQSWSDFLTVKGSPVDDPTIAPRFPDGWNWTELPEIEGMALFAWVAGYRYVVRWHDRSDVPLIRNRTWTPKGPAREWYEERTRTDQASIDLQIDEFLNEARIPQQPAGYRWFVILPHTHAESEMWSTMDRAEQEATRRGYSPVVLRDALGELLASLFLCADARH